MTTLTNTTNSDTEIDPYFDDEESGWDTDEDIKIEENKKNKEKEMKDRKKKEEKRQQNIAKILEKRKNKKIL
tara:strand:- start:7792 stop:8007 length:216 start_codon:yes stop_codon:yes gene_type:complete